MGVGRPYFISLHVSHIFWFLLSRRGMCIFISTPNGTCAAGHVINETCWIPKLLTLPFGTQTFTVIMIHPETLCLVDCPVWVYLRGCSMRRGCSSTAACCPASNDDSEYQSDVLAGQAWNLFLALAVGRMRAGSPTMPLIIEGGMLDLFMTAISSGIPGIKDPLDEEHRNICVSIWSCVRWLRS